MKLAPKFEALLVITGIVMSVFVSTIVLLFVRHIIITDTQKHLETVAKVQEHRIERVATRNKERAQRIIDHTSIRQRVAAYLRGNNYEQTALRTLLNDAIAMTPSIVSVTVFDANGQLISTTAKGAGIIPLSDDVRVQLLHTRETSLALIAEEGKAGAIHVYAPIVEDNRVIGILQLQSDLSDLYFIVSDTLSLGQTGETGLAIRKGNYALTLNNLRFAPESSLSWKTTMSSTEKPIIRALLHEELFFDDTIDYRGQRVFSVTRYIPNLGIGLVVKIDYAEVFAQALRLGRWLIVLNIFLLLFLTLLARKLASLVIRPLHILLKQIHLLRGNQSGYHAFQSNNELQEILTAFDAMAKEEMSKTRALEAAKIFSEAEVRERTAELRKANLQLATNLNRTEAIIDKAPIGILVIDEQESVIHINQAFCHAFNIGPAPQELIGISMEQLRRDISQLTIDPAEFVHEIKKIVSLRTPCSGKLVNLRDGRCLQCTYIPAFHDDRYMGHTWLYTDVTHEKRLDAAKSEFITLASHQLRTPLTAIRWALRRLNDGEKGPLTPDQLVLAQEALTRTKHMVNTINVLLTLSRLEAGTVRKNAEEIAVQAFLKEMLESLQESIQDHRLTCRMTCDEEIFLQSDRQLLHEIISILLDNAIRYTPPGGSIAVSAKTDEHGVHIRVQDTGLGVPAHQQQKLFQKFFRADNIMKSDPNGLGIGLYLAQKITSFLGGTIDWTSRENKGTSFTIFFPLSHE